VGASSIKMIYNVEYRFFETNAYYMGIDWKQCTD